jgi:hypothetical protein
MRAHEQPMFYIIIEEDVKIDWKQEKRRTEESKQSVMDKIKSVIKIRDINE